MDSTITRSKIDEYRAYIKQYQPYADDSPEMQYLDAEIDPCRLKATTARRILEAYGIDPYDDNDYGVL